MNPSHLLRPLAVLLVASGLAVGGCNFFETWNNAPVCTPRAVTSCLCDTGKSGQEICDDDGQGYGSCTCLDGGGPGDAETGDTGTNVSQDR